MDNAHLLFGLRGRITRRQFWFGIVIIAAVEIALTLGFGLPLMPEGTLSLHKRIAEAVIELLGLYPAIAVASKRLQDRNQPVAWVWLIVAITLVTVVIDLLGLADDPNTMGFGYVIVGFIAAVVGLGFLIELGFRRGTAGPNRYGPDPLAAPTVLPKAF